MKTFAIAALLVVAQNVIAQPTVAGKGEHRFFLIPGENVIRNISPIVMEALEREPLSATGFDKRKHYIKVEALGWYVNKESSWFTDRVASGTLEIKLNSETYNFALGNYKLDQGAKTAPIFNRPLIKNRVYRGGDLSLTLFLKSIEEPTPMAQTLNNIANSALNVADGMISGAGVSGPSVLLTGAGKELTSGVRYLLDNGKKPIPLFDPGSGIEFTLNMEKILSSESYILVHRGANLDRNLITIKDNGDTTDVLYKNASLNDGVWVLFRLTRSHAFGGERPWDGNAEQIRKDLTALMKDFEIKSVTQKQVIEALTISLSDRPTLGDRIQLLCRIIGQDFSLTEAEAVLEAGRHKTLLALARSAAEKNLPSIYLSSLEVTGQKIVSNKTMLPLFEAESALITSLRASKTIGAEKALTGKDLIDTLQKVQTAKGKTEMIAHGPRIEIPNI